MKFDENFDLRALVDQLPYAIHVYGIDGFCIYANEGWERLYLASRDQLEGYNILKDPQLVRKGLIPFVERAYAGETLSLPPFYYNPREIGKDADPRWIQSDLVPYKIGGKVIAVMIILRDFTEQFQKEQPAQTEPLQLARILDNVSDGVVVQDRTGAWVFVNPMGAEMCGYSSVEEMKNSSVTKTLGSFEVLTEGLEPFPYNRLPAQQVFRGIDQPKDEIMVVRHRETGKLRWSLVTARPIKDTTGDTVLAVSLIKDISLLRDVDQYKENARIAEERFKLIADHVQEVFWISDPAAAAPIFVSPAFRHIWGLDPEEVIKNPKAFFDAVHPDDRERLLAFVQTKLLDTYEVEYRIRRPDGSLRWIRSRAFSIRDASGKIIYTTGISEDITEKRRNLQAKDELLSITSHELKTPITSLKLQLQIAESALSSIKGASDPMAGILEKSIAASLQQVDRLSTVITNILDFSRLNDGRSLYNFQRINIALLLRDLVARLDDLARNSGTKITLETESVVMIQCDPFRLEQVFMNLLTNALKYGGKTPVKVTAKTESHQVHFSVSDQGMGIPKEAHERIFERFERAVPHTHVSGFGIGLYVSREIVSNHNGRIWVESAPDQGAKFHLVLPVTQPAKLS